MVLYRRSSMSWYFLLYSSVPSLRSFPGPGLKTLLRFECVYRMLLLRWPTSSSCVLLWDSTPSTAQIFPMESRLGEDPSLNKKPRPTYQSQSWKKCTIALVQKLFQFFIYVRWHSLALCVVLCLPLFHCPPLSRMTFRRAFWVLLNLITYCSAGRS